MIAILTALFFEFFKAGLFAVGGGLATLPFLYDIASRHDWMPLEMMPDMIAISESTPGPIGINMATYAGYNAAGVWGGILATCALVLPSVIIIIWVSKFLEKFKQNHLVQSAFSGLRPAVTGLIAAAGWQIFRISLFAVRQAQTEGAHLLVSLDFIGIQLSGSSTQWGIIPKAALLFVLLFFLVRTFNKAHPVIFIAGAALAGILFRF